MSRPTPTITTLNPFAPEYSPIPPGAVVQRPHAQPPLVHPPPPLAAFHHLYPPPPLSPLEPPPLLLSTQIFAYVPPTPYGADQHPFYTSHTTFYGTPRSPVATNPSPPARPSPTQSEVVIHCGPSGRGFSTRQRRGFRGDRGGGGENSWSGREEKNGRELSDDMKKKLEFRGENKISASGLQKEFRNRHKVMPLKRDEDKTTVMIKNIPYDCPRKELIRLLDGFCSLENERRPEEDLTSSYDFLYLPIDFRTKKGRGFAFVNFTDASAVWKFFNAFHMKKWEFVHRNKWPKKIEIVCAKIQGKEALVTHFSQSIFDCETDEFLPVCFSPPRDGSGQPVKLTIVGNRRGSSHREPRNNH